MQSSKTYSVHMHMRGSSTSPLAAVQSAAAVMLLCYHSAPHFLQCTELKLLGSYHLSDLGVLGEKFGEERGVLSRALNLMSPCPCRGLPGSMISLHPAPAVGV